MGTLLRQAGIFQNGFGGRVGSCWEQRNWCPNNPGDRRAGRVAGGAGGTAGAERRFGEGIEEARSTQAGD